MGYGGMETVTMLARLRSLRLLTLRNKQKFKEIKEDSGNARPTRVFANELETR